MGGEDFQEEAVLAAVKPLRAAEFTGSGNEDTLPAERSLPGYAVESQSNLEILYRETAVYHPAYHLPGAVGWSCRSDYY